MTTDGDALLAAVLANPADDAPRLVYADWLEEHDQRWRAALIRWQIDTRTPGLLACVKMYGDPPAWRWADGCPRIDMAMGDEERAGFPPAREGVGLFVYRGFVDTVNCPTDWWLDHGPAIVAAHPIERVTLTDKRPTRMYSANPHHGSLRFRFFRAGRTPPPDLLPDELPDEIWTQRGTGGWRFASSEDGMTALSDAALAWAKKPEAIHKPSLA